MNDLSKKQKEYLLIINKLFLKNNFVNLNEISEFMKVKSSTANSMINKLKDFDLINYKKNKPITMTKKGIEECDKLAYYDICLCEFLEIIGVPKHIIDIDCDKILKNINPITSKKLEDFSKQFKEKNLKKFIKIDYCDTKKNILEQLEEKF